MTDSNVHRIDFGEIAGEEYAGQWADIAKVRTWETRNKIVDAAVQAPSAYRTTLLATAIVRWSLPIDPDMEGVGSALDEYLGERLFESVRDFYSDRAKERAERSKSRAREGARADGAARGEGAA